MKTRADRIQKDLERLASFNATPESGLTRFSYTPEHKMARDYIVGQMTSAGLEVYEDPIGNIYGKRKGTNNSLPSVMIGSHFDSVANGGIFDGMAGVVAGLEIARVLEENKIENESPIEIVAIVEEEGGRFSTPVFGGRAIAGKIDFTDLDHISDKEGVSFKEALTAFGLDVNVFNQVKRDPKTLKAFLELHIEQGPILENAGKDIGIVEGIVGIVAYNIEVLGQPDHAGTTPMDVRKDALVAASKVISQLPDIAKTAGKGTVSTVGQITNKPFAINIVPRQVNFSVEIRSLHPECIQYVEKQLNESLETVCKESGLEFSMKKYVENPETILSEPIASILEEKSDSNGFSSLRMASGAGHDAMFISGITETAMVFVPSKNGRSHCPEEWTDYDYIAKGTKVMLDTVLELQKDDEK